LALDRTDSTRRYFPKAGYAVAFDRFPQWPDIGEQPTVIAEAWARLLKPLGKVFGDNFYEPGYAAYCGVI
jgi:hypothetical protein